MKWWEQIKHGRNRLTINLLSCHADMSQSAILWSASQRNSRYRIRRTAKIIIMARNLHSVQPPERSIIKQLAQKGSSENKTNLSYTNIHVVPICHEFQIAVLMNRFEYNKRPKLRIISSKSQFTIRHLPVPVAARSKVWFCVRSIAGIVGSNFNGGMDVCLF